MLTIPNLGIKSSRLLLHTMRAHKSNHQVVRKPLALAVGEVPTSLTTYSQSNNSHEKYYTIIISLQCYFYK